MSFTGTDRSDALSAAIGRTWTDDVPWEFITDLTAIGNRMGGSPGEHEAAAVIADAFTTAGLHNVTQNPFQMHEWRRGSSTLQLAGPTDRTFDTIALPYSPADTVTAEFVDAGYGTPAEIDDLDVTDKIVVASTTTPEGGRFIHRMEKFSYAIESGAVGFVFVNHIPGQLPPTGSLTFGHEADAVAVGVSLETGDWLSEYAVNTPGEHAEMGLTVQAETTAGESRNVVGTVGPDTDEELLLLAHYDGHDIAEGALDNGCGIATVLTAARILAAIEDELTKRVRVVAVGCEEIGLLGSEQLAEHVSHDSIHGVLNVDGAGRFRDLVAMTHTSTETEEVAQAVSTQTRHPITIVSEPHPFSDQWPFVRDGIPALQLHSESNDRGRGWGHTTADTRDKVDDRDIREHGILTALLAIELTDTELPRLDKDVVTDAFREAEFETGMKAANLWPDAWE